jgi:flagellin-like hook-associated protein FlgL
MLQRVRDLAVQYKNGTLSTDDRTAIQSEVNQLGSEIERIGQSAAFNGISLLSNSGTITFQIGANDGDSISVSTISLGSAVSSSVFSLSVVDIAGEMVEFTKDQILQQAGTSMLSQANQLPNSVLSQGSRLNSLLPTAN